MLLFVPLVLVTAVLIIGVFAMPAMVSTCRAAALSRSSSAASGGTFRRQRVERRGGAALAGAAGAAVAAAVAVSAAWPLLPLALFGYLNQRVFRYDALAEHASGWEMQTLIRRHRGSCSCWVSCSRCPA